MEWDKATVGAWHGVGGDITLSYAAKVKQWDIIRALEFICENSVFNYKDGRYCYYTIDELEPTFNNAWDYEWPNDFIPKGQNIGRKNNPN